MSTLTSKKTFRVQLIMPEKVCLDQPVQFLAAPAVGGEVGILANHAPLLCQLAPGALRVQAAGGWSHFFLSGGVLKVINNLLVIISQEIIAASEINRSATEAKLAEIQKRPISPEYPSTQKDHDLACLHGLLKVARLQPDGGSSVVIHGSRT